MSSIASLQDHETLSSLNIQLEDPGRVGEDYITLGVSELFLSWRKEKQLHHHHHVPFYSFNE